MRDIAATPVRLALRICCLLGLWPAASPAADPPVQPVVALVEPQALNPPTGDFWPGDVDREARVVLRFTVTARGYTKDVEVVDGFYEARFADAAVKFITRSRFKPATRNGIPEDFEGYSMTVTFQAGQDRIVGITPSFRKELVKAIDLIREQRPQEAHMQVEHMLADEVKLLYEVAVMYAMLAETNEKIGELTDALFNARKATAPTDSKFPAYRLNTASPRNSFKRYVLPPDLLLTTFRRRILLDAKLGYVADALQAYSELVGLKPLAPDDPLPALAAELQRMLQDPSPLVAQAKIPQNGIWEHSSVRQTFSIAQVTGGKLKDIFVSCGTYRRVLSYQPDVDWTLPSIYSRCGLRFTGDVGTEFRIVEASLPAGKASEVVTPPQ